MAAKKKAGKDAMQQISDYAAAKQRSGIAAQDEQR